MVEIRLEGEKFVWTCSTLDEAREYVAEKRPGAEIPDGNGPASWPLLLIADPNAGRSIGTATIKD
ncbi:MAG: hypothetical protein K8T25_19365 [Planctomycetia bacterium]|nr:hypothetical protein [Planctomycetia bacterium]